MDTAEFRNQLLEIRNILESFLQDYGENPSEDFQTKLNSLNKEYELIHDSLLTIINYFSLQQNAIRALLLIENVTREKNIKLQEVDNLLNAMRMLILPQVETFLYNLKSAVKSKERVLTYLEKSPVQKIPDLVQDMVAMDKKFLDIIEQPQASSSSNLFEQTLQSLIMSHLENSKVSIEKMLKNLQSENPGEENSSPVEEDTEDP